MPTALLILLLALQATTLLLVLLCGRTPPEAGLSREVAGLLTAMRDEFERSRRESAEADARSRQELAGRLAETQEALGRALADFREQLTALFRDQAASVERRLQSLQQGNESRWEAARDTIARSLAEQRTELGVLFKSQADSVDRRLGEVRQEVGQRLEAIRQGNEARLEEMRRTVDEKLQTTLDKRLGESFVMVSQRLDKVHDGLGQMKALAGNVLDLNRLLNNVKDRGTFGEVQLGNLLDQALGERQYETNAAVSPDRPGQRVEFAVRLPSRDRPGEAVLLPIDAKFPLEDYRRLMAAQQAVDAAAAEAAAKALISTVLQEARKIRDKYVCPPATTDFAFMFLPTEGLYAEVASRPEVMDKLRELHVVPAGPINLYALLDIVGMVYRFIAVQEQASRVWELLGAVKSEFGKFGDVLHSVRRKIDAAANEFDKVDVRTRAISRRLQEVQELPGPRGQEVLALESAATAEADGTEP